MTNIKIEWLDKNTFVISNEKCSVKGVGTEKGWRIETSPVKERPFAREAVICALEYMEVIPKRGKLVF